jgi:hypothetical protein
MSEITGILPKEEGAKEAATPDVFPRGKTLYTNGMGVEMTKRIMKFLQSNDIHFIADPFVGRGTTLLIEKMMGFKGGGLVWILSKSRAVETTLQRSL